MKLGAASRHFVGGMGWSLRMIAMSIGSVYGECDAGGAVKLGFRRTRLNSP
jgi:hypothetical protein